MSEQNQNTPVFESIKAASTKKQNPEQVVEVSLWKNNQFLGNTTVTKRAPDAKALLNEVAFWAGKLGMVAGKPAVIEVVKPVEEQKPAAGAQQQKRTGTRG